MEGAGRRLSNKIAVVTGGANGIGASIVQRLVSEGCGQVHLVDIGEAKIQHQAVIHHQIDISREENVVKLVQDIQKSLGGDHIDILVNNAACFIYQAAEDITEAALDKSYAVNIKGTALMTKHLVPLLSSRGGGSAIINMASVNAGIAIPGFVPYAMTKAAIIQLTRNSAVDLGKLNIRVNSVSPGPILTEATQRHGESQGKSLDEMVAELTDRLVIKRMGRPEEVASTVAFLASDDASFITGIDITVDGGFTLH